MSFEVSTPRLRDAARQFRAMADAYPAAHAYVQQHVTVPAGGNIIDSIKFEIERARTDLQSVYRSDGPLPAYLDGADAALRATADDYDTVDAAQRAAYDALLPEAVVPTDDDGSADWGFDADGETAGLSTTDLTSELTPPADYFEGLEVWRAIEDNVSYAVSCLWVFDAIAQVPFFHDLPKPTQELRDGFNGDWEAVGLVSMALDSLAGFHNRLQDEAGASAIGLQGAWSGHAADAAFASLAMFDAVVSGHRSDLVSTSSALSGYATGMRFLTDALCSALDTLVGLVIDLFKFNPLDPLGLLEWLARGGSQSLRWVNALSKAIDLIITIIDLCFALAGLFPLTLGQWGRYPGLRVPRADVPVLEAPDVDGP